MKGFRGLMILGAACLVVGGGIVNSSTQPSSPAPWQVNNQATAAAEQATALVSPLIINNTLTPGPGQRLFVFVNNLKQTIWVGGETSPGYPSIKRTGWVLPAGNSASIEVPNKWNGRFWGRTGCNFDSNGNGHCETGDCAGGFQCTGTGELPATLAEFNLEDTDYYDISLVDGSNVPLYINTIGSNVKPPDPMNANGCTSAGCTSDANLSCLPALAVKSASGAVVGCESSCTKFDTDQYCCRGAYYNAQTCIPDTWPVNSAKIFKTAEPFAYSFAYDDATSTFACAGSCGYRIVFGVSS